MWNVGVDGEQINKSYFFRFFFFFFLFLELIVYFSKDASIFVY